MKLGQTRGMTINNHHLPRRSRVMVVSSSLLNGKLVSTMGFVLAAVLVVGLLYSGSGGSNRHKVQQPSQQQRTHHLAQNDERPDDSRLRGKKKGLHLYSTAFANGTAIPAMYARSNHQGGGIPESAEMTDQSPPLHWSGVPEQTKSLVLIVDDPDAPDPRAPQMTWVHWVVYNIPPDRGFFPAGISLNWNRGGGSHHPLEGRNDWNEVGYGGPSPPIGRHRYFFTLYAVDTMLPDYGLEATKAKILQGMEGHVLTQAVLIGTYQAKS